MTRREAAKAERRERIVKAVITLTEQSGLDGFSMRDLAKQAGVSHATPFNLFGSKAEVISHIFQADLEAFRTALNAKRSGDTLDRLFDMITMATEYFRQKGGLYRALHASFLGTATDHVYREFTESRQQFFVDLIKAAQTANLLRNDMSSELMARAIYHQWEAVMLDWVRGSITLNHMEREVSFGFAAILLGFATPPVQSRLQDKMLAYQTQILASISQ